MKRKIIFLIGLLAFGALIISCDPNGTKKTEKERVEKEKEQQQQQKKEQQEKQDLLDMLIVTGGSKNAMLDGEYFTPEGERIRFSSPDSTNIACFSNEIAEYTVDGNTITFDFSRQIKAYENINVENYLKALQLLAQNTIEFCEKELNKEGLTDKRKKEMQKALNDAKQKKEYFSSLDGAVKHERAQEKESLDYFKKRLEKETNETEKQALQKQIDEITAKLAQTDEQLKADISKRMEEVFQWKNRLAAALKTVNPVTGTLSADKQTITIKKMVTDVKEDGTPVYVENAVFTKK
ncbi:hypothetical protein [Treponema phagedenis]|uniref:hypothetical protein n=1 Tax=Treponema phagedenis TaxID=162 RepID=UPI0011E6A947|nr:hypothetical protein [Treponema phagedenis]QEK04138.1 hypothetical protein FUT83_10195 [Treponema phagedenis]QEK09753.1 hypothetical protein FUT81_10110 [Treponema phagedenis]